VLLGILFTADQHVKNATTLARPAAYLTKMGDATLATQLLLGRKI